MMATQYRQDHHPIMRIVVVIVVIAMLIPLFILIIWSFNSLWQFPDVIPDAWTLRGYENLFFGSRDFVEIVCTSLLVTITVCVLSVVIATLTAQALVFYDFPGKNILDFFVYLPQVVPAVALGIGAHLLFIRAGLNNTVFAVIITQTLIGMPYAIKMVVNATRLLGKSVTEQAIVLGSSYFKAYFQVSFHLLIPTIISAMCMVFTASFSDYFLTFLLGGGQVQTFAVAIFPMISASDVNVAAAYATVYVIFAFLFFLVLEWISRVITRKQETSLV